MRRVRWRRAMRKLSEPPRRIAALPAFRHSAPASAVTLGRLSKMTPMTPSGVATRSIVRPFGRSNVASTRPTGRAARRRPRPPPRSPRGAPRRAARRSMKAGVCPPPSRRRHRPHWRRGLPPAAPGSRPPWREAPRSSRSAPASASRRAAARAPAAELGRHEPATSGTDSASAALSRSARRDAGLGAS